MKKKTLSIIIFILALILFLFIIRNINITSSSIELSKRYSVNEATGVIEGAESVYIPGKGGAILFFHGLSSSPQEFRELAGKLHNETGYTVYVPRLTGHGTNLNDFSKTKWQQLVKDADDAYAMISPQLQPGDKFFIVGQSSGALLEVDLAAKHDFDGLVMYAPSFLMLEEDVKYLKPLEFLYPAIPYLKKGKIGDIEDPEALKERVAYPFFSSQNLLEFVKLIDYTKTKLKDVKEPILIMMSKNDHSVSLDNPEYVMKNVSSLEKKSIWLENSGHVISVDYEKERVFQETLAFIKAHAS